jgi:hypothetical protein
MEWIEDSAMIFKRCVKNNKDTKKIGNDFYEKHRY